jgi:hypothetical protein
VALAAVAFGGLALKRRHDRYLALALDHLRRERQAWEDGRRAIEWVEAQRARLEAQRTVPRDGFPQPVMMIFIDEKQLARDEERARWELAGYTAEVERQARLRRKYDRIARYPWLPAPPEPSDPIEERARRFRERASYHASVAQWAFRTWSGDPVHRQAVTAYHAAMSQKYEKASWHPSLDVEPDPPLPWKEPGYLRRDAAGRTVAPWKSIGIDGRPVY